MNTKEKVIEVCKSKGVSVSKLEKDLGYGNGSIMKASSISADRVIEIADYLHISVDELLGRPNEGYYLNPEVAELTQTLKERPEMQILFDATRDVSREDIMFIIQMVDRMRRK